MSRHFEAGHLEPKPYRAFARGASETFGQSLGNNIARLALEHRPSALKLDHPLRIRIVGIGPVARCATIGNVGPAITTARIMRFEKRETIIAISTEALCSGLRRVRESPKPFEAF